MKDLLLKWAELETESRCRLNDGCIEFRIGDERLIQVYVDPLVDYPPEVFACIQLGVQEALAHRQWHFHLDSGEESADGSFNFQACIFAPDPDSHGDFSYTAVSAIAAESLLSAYVQALEAVEVEEEAA